ncbi:MAG: AMP-binding protein [Nocardioides sp.]
MGPGPRLVEPPFAKWFTGATINPRSTAWTATSPTARATRSPSTGSASPRTTPGDITYAQLKDEVCKATNALVELGVQKGDRVAIYMPMIPETAIAMLACARLALRTPWSSAASPPMPWPPASRTARARVVITSDGGYRRGAPSALKPAVDEACSKVAAAGGSVDRVPVVRRTGQDLGEGGWHDDATCGGTTSWRPPVHRARGGAARLRAPALRHVHLRTTKSRRASCTPPAATWSARPSRTGRCSTSSPETDVYWCTADVGWVTGHSYMVYGPLANGVTQVMYEGTPDSPTRAVGGRSSRLTASPSSTPHRRRSGRS